MANRWVYPRERFRLQHPNFVELVRNGVRASVDLANEAEAAFDARQMLAAGEGYIAMLHRPLLELFGRRLAGEPYHRLRRLLLSGG